MLSRFFQRRTIWWPTLPGWLFLLGILSAPLLLWWFEGESFLSHPDRLPAEVLVVEGWIGTEGVRAAKAEFDRGHYRYIVTTGSLTGHNWNERRWNVVEIAERELLRLHVPAEQIISAPAKDADTHRTYSFAVAARQVLQARELQPGSINVFTLGAHARRSRLVYAKVLGPAIKVGVVAWLPPGYEREPWWKSSDRSEDMLKETAGYLFELLLNSGRGSNSPATSSLSTTAGGAGPDGVNSPEVPELKPK